ncbi:hypothetical protein [Actinacidiphila soli]|uniref:hypothetical protein n=1 Tax=Actinacidiphila soli TaxID=2487275 RepID=UPI000FCA657C|nr:hypothetical protein [Actinacidiphila soli]
MLITDPTDRLAGPYTLGNTGSVTSRLADVLDGPHLQALLVERFALDVWGAEQAAASIGTTIQATWRASSYGEVFQTWLGRMPETLLKLLVEMAARAANDEFASCHELRIARLMLTELDLEIRNR